MLVHLFRTVCHYSIPFLLATDIADPWNKHSNDKVGGGGVNKVWKRQRLNLIIGLMR